jgi:hypothetical protein
MTTCAHCSAEFQRSRPDANSEKFCSVLCRLLSGLAEAASGCWEWTHSCAKAGYGAIKVDGVTRTVHTLSYELFVGPIPEGMFVLHRCDNRRCGLPGHLFLGTHQDNMTDAQLKGRAGMSGRKHSAETKEKIRARHLGKKPAWANDPAVASAAALRAWETRRAKYGESGRSR